MNHLTLSPRSPLLALLCAALFACGTSVNPGGDGATDALVDTLNPPADVRPDGGAAPDTPANCCPVFATWSCGCLDLGGSRQAGQSCPTLCDAAQTALRRGVDANGCEFYEFVGVESCNLPRDVHAQDAVSPADAP